MCGLSGRFSTVEVFLFYFLMWSNSLMVSCVAMTELSQNGRMVEKSIAIEIQSR
ncbi:hypothetical protein [Rubritalea tangerina]|uniref:hypothetical protein n=1 Tax=Rubritalea tangerina TaxID=430798 RepID=UPI0036122F0E